MNPRRCDCDCHRPGHPVGASCQTWDPRCGVIHLAACCSRVGEKFDAAPQAAPSPPDFTYGPEGMPMPPRWASLALLLILAGYAGFLLYVLGFAAIKLLAAWQLPIAAALVAAAAVFFLHHLIYGRRGC